MLNQGTWGYGPTTQYYWDIFPDTSKNIGTFIL